ncbi:aminodeoxychorismate synthase, component I [Anaerostipes sp. 494a]|uniref:aminodeoxychorismate synthase component I n=1 Tax=Anaerostipes sp. 494a TaxID=1261636 RepID=UPI000951459D|nr:aminodeoxychorismate synthase component I [Anaerostipes sp. 494a]OLR59745.1 aminodeoxychorismate synthase, component I [Anaerostipes sp. 494a]
MATKICKLDFYRKAENIFEQYKNDNMAIFLDSSLENQQGKYSMIGLNPYLILKEIDGVFYKNDVPQVESFEQGVQKYLERYKENNPTSLPLISGAFGYFSYDYGRKFEDIHSRHPKKLFIPDALFVFHDLLIIDDKSEQTLYITARGELEDPDIAMERLKTEIKECQSYKIPEKHNSFAEFIPNFTKEDYKNAIQKMISYIVEGDIYIANMTQQLTIESKKDPYDVYRYLRTYNPAPFGSFFQCGDFQIISVSPERFLQIKKDRIETRPIKGTRKRGETKQEDILLKEELQNSSKDRSELLMIVDLERNDLNHICKSGSVNVTRHFEVETYATVFHLVTTIIGTLKENLEISDLLGAVFPGDSITGAPKIRAMEIIDELEHDRRNLYTGSLGYFSFDGNCDFNIIIRTAIHQNKMYHLGVGGGITCESDLEFEYEETLQNFRVESIFR